MEIKPQELRIGNLLHREDGTGVLVDALAIVEASQRQIANGNTGLKGIDLTPEWLEKFGFVYNGGSGYKAPHNTEHWYFTLRNGFMPNSIARGSIKTDDYIGCKYVHQLQNLYFALTGKELAIDNKSI